MSNQKKSGQSAKKFGGTRDGFSAGRNKSRNSEEKSSGKKPGMDREFKGAPGKKKSFSDTDPDKKRSSSFKKSDKDTGKKYASKDGEKKSGYDRDYKRSSDSKKSYSDKDTDKKRASSFKKGEPDASKKYSSFDSEKKSDTNRDYKRSSDSKKSYSDKDTDKKRNSSFKKGEPDASKKYSSFDSEKKSDTNREHKRSSDSKKSYSDTDGEKKREYNAKKFVKGSGKKYAPFDREKKPKGDPLPSFSEDIRLNKFLANAGICSRREADVLIATGIVKVNGVIVTELGYKVKPGDEVKYDGATVRAEKKRYVLLNKPKDFITTMDDPMDRKTVMVLVAKACKERIYPVGRLDRNTTGLLLFTNDGDLAKKLTHPRYEVKKLYHVETDEPVSFEQVEKLLSGVELEDGGFVKADKVEILKESKGHELGVEIHSGKYRVVRRMFESLGHVVKRLDRVMFAGLTKKDLPRGNYRHLTDVEVNYLRML
ncbi:MAG: rRNA pseudouridine synthase [Crocinitomicaceae bacterium]|nr:rRNA pseudouridine synthase [Crocinitomicaceae bacterium]MBK8927935.1 rRNA pseudouridine synthase [Crocinitomicaceae bacterium]